MRLNLLLKCHKVGKRAPVGAKPPLENADAVRVVCR